MPIGVEWARLDSNTPANRSFFWRPWQHRWQHHENTSDAMSSIRAQLFSTRDLAIYGALVGTLAAAWGLYVGIVLDRARIRVRAWEGHAVKAALGGGTHTPILVVRVSNRGRRGTTIESVGRVLDMKRKASHELSSDITVGQVPKRLDEGEGHSFVHGAAGGYAFGGMPVKR